MLESLVTVACTCAAIVALWAAMGAVDVLAQWLRDDRRR